MMQTELPRPYIKNKIPDSPNESSSKNISYTEAVQLSPIVLKSTSSQTFSRTQVNAKRSWASNKTKEASAKAIKNGKMLVIVKKN